MRHSIPYDETCNTLCTNCADRVAKHFNLNESEMGSMVRTEFDRTSIYSSVLSNTASFAARYGRRNFKEDNKKCVVMYMIISLTILPCSHSPISLSFLGPTC